MDPRAACSFCGRAAGFVRRLVASDIGAFVCDGCLDAAVTAVGEAPAWSHLARRERVFLACLAAAPASALETAKDALAWIEAACPPGRIKG